MAAAAIPTSVAKLFHWYSYTLTHNAQNIQQPFFQRHFTKNRDAIVKAIHTLEGTAVILGAGAGHDLPLKELAERFEKIILVDIDIEGPKNSLQSLPEELRGKFSIEQADLTGFFEELSNHVEALARQRLPFETFVAKVLDILPALKKKPYPYQELEPSFICSSLVCHQLSAMIHSYLDGPCKGVYGKEFTIPAEKTKAYDNWLLQIQLDHINELEQLASKKEGRVYFADHFSASHIAISTSGEETTKHPLKTESFNGAKQIQTYLKERFHPVQEKNWGWSFPLRTVEQPIKISRPDGSSTIVPAGAELVLKHHVSSFSLLKV